jgi:hypothetical protein
MAINAMLRRVARLEAAIGPAVAFYLWADRRVSAEEVIASRFPHGVPDGVSITIFGWQETEVTRAHRTAGSSPYGALRLPSPSNHSSRIVAPYSLSVIRAKS